MSGVYNNLQIIKGQKFTLQTYKQESGTGIVAPLDGLKARITVSYRDYDGELAFEGTTENGCITIVKDIIDILITSTQTSLFRFDDAVYEIEIIDSFDEVTGHLRGRLKILKGVINE
jgi:hypothetical protein